MKVNCRCLKCKSLFTIDYSGEEFKCPSCSEIVLFENDDRITDDYVCERNGNLNVIGDDIDEMISETDSDDLDKLFGDLMDLEDKMHAEELGKNAKSLEDAKIYDCVRYGKLFWTVIGIENDCKLLLSKECMGYDFDFEYGDDTSYVEEDEFNYQWESGQYRRYLNMYFLDKFFSDEEKMRIVPYQICIKEKESEHFIEDKVFLLSKNEVMDYLPIPEDRMATMHVMYNDVKRGWFLRIDDNSVKQPDIVGSDGELDTLPEGYVLEWFRPAIVVK